MSVGYSYIVGLTGGIGSGKSTVADLFAGHGVPIVDTDQIAHQLTGPGGTAMPAIVAAFGADIVSPDGALDRAAMRRLVFADPAARRRLEAVLHPLIRAESERRCAAADGPYVLLVVPLLVESGDYRQRCREILVVDCSEATQIERVMARSGLTEDEAKAIITAQASRAERLAVADAVINNDGPSEHLPAQVATLHQRFCCAAAKVKNEG